MLAALGADGPHPALAEQLYLFGQFVGSWDVDITYHRPDGTRYDEGSFAPGQTTRWIFSAITPNTFKWRHVDRVDGSGAELLRQTMDARRRHEPG
jgi:hypothetical protein